MPYLRKLASGNWQATVRNHAGERFTETFPLRSQAREWGQEQEAKLRRNAYQDPQAGKIKFAEWRDRWWEARVVEPHTQPGDASCIRTHITPYWSDWEVRAIARLDVQSWVRKMVVDKKGASAIRRAYNLMSSIMRAALDENLIAVTPCRRIDLPREAVKPPQWFTVEEAQAILGELQQPWQTMVLLAFYTGLRWGELAGLHGHRIDWRRSRLFVVEVNTKSGIKEYPKSSKSRREVPIPEHVLEALARHMRGRDRSGVVFTTVTKGRRRRGAATGLVSRRTSSSICWSRRCAEGWRGRSSPATEEIGVQRPLLEMGMDSVMTVAAGRRLGRLFRLTLPATLLWNRPTVRAIAEYLAECLAPRGAVGYRG